MTTLHSCLNPAVALPKDADKAVLVGRVWLEGQGAVLVRVTPEHVSDISQLAPTMSELLELPDPAGSVRKFEGTRLAETGAVLANSACDLRHKAQPWLLAPCDL